jgi:zinc transport system substrate-binding protein
VEFERAWMERIISNNRDMRIVDCSEGITLMLMESHEHEEHHGHEDGFDPHVWTSVRNAMAMVENIYGGLSEADPENREYYFDNKMAYLSELEALDAELSSAFGSLDSRAFMVFHPAWGYLARDYGLTQVPVEKLGKEPGAKDIAELIEHARREDIRVVFASPQFSQKSAEAIASEIGGTVLLINPLAPDYADNMRRVSNEIRDSLT